MIVDGTDWNLKDVVSVDRETFIEEQIKGPVYRQYKETDRRSLFDMVYSYGVSGEITEAVHPPPPL